MHQFMGRFLTGVAVLAVLLAAAPAVAVTGLGALDTTNDANYQSALDAINSLDYPSALTYLNQSITANPENGAAYIARAQVDLVLGVPSQAVTDATQGISLLRASSVCDQFLPTDSPLLAVAATNSTLDATMYGYTGYGSLLNGTSLYTTNIYSTPSTSTSTTSSGTTSGTTTGTTSGTTTGTTSGTSTSGTTTSGSSSSTSSSSSTASTSAFSSSEGSQNLPVAEDLTDKDKTANETRNQYNETLTQMTMYSLYCGAAYLRNMDKLVSGYTLLGDAYLAQGSYSNAQLAYNGALALDETNAKATGGLGLTYIGQGSGTAALSELNLAVSYDPTLASVYVDRGAYYVSIDDPSRALEDYNTALSLDPNYPRAYDAIGRVRYSAGEYQAAVDQYTKALAVQPSYVAALLHRATAWQALATANPDQAATYNQYAQDDKDKASSLQALVTSSATATSATTTTTTTTGTTTSTVPISLDSGIR